MGDAQPKPAEKGVGWGETLRTRSQGREGSVKAEGVLPVMQWKGGILAYQVNVVLWIARLAITWLIHGSTLSLS